MNTYNKIIENLNKNWISLLNIPSAEEVAEASMTFKQEEYSKSETLREILYVMQRAIEAKKDYCSVVFFSYHDESMKNFVCNIIPYLNKIGYNIVYRKSNSDDYRFYIIWNNYEYSLLEIKSQSIKEDEFVEYKAIREE